MQGCGTLPLQRDVSLMRYPGENFAERAPNDSYWEIDLINRVCTSMCPEIIKSDKQFCQLHNLQPCNHPR